MDKHTERVLEIFEQITEIPRCSKHEEEIGKWLMNFATDNNLDAEMDEVGNVLIKSIANKSESSEPIVLQCHMDMVCEKEPDSDHDFSKDPIKLIQDGDWLTADRTTLGADNGIGIGIALALVTDDEIVRPPVEILITVDEETGLTGAKALKSDFISGKTLINLDSEDEGVFTIGCAGGRDSVVKLSLPLIPSQEGELLRISAGGCVGGHSGVDIHEGRANAIKVLARVLKKFNFDSALQIVGIKGGSARNAIARDAEAVISSSEFNSEAVNSLMNKIQNEFAKTDPGLEIKIEEVDGDFSKALSTEDSERLIDLLLAFPHGVFAMSQDIEGLVETSNNMANVRLEDGIVTIISSQRSSVMSRLDEITQKIESVARLANADVESNVGYPSWQPDTSSALLQKCKDVYKKLFDKEPVVEAIHAGLECGLIGDKFEGMDMISLGPTLKNPHSPDEKLFIPSVGKVYEFLMELMRGL